MHRLLRSTAFAAAVLALGTTTGCAAAGGLGSVLGSVLGQQGGQGQGQGQQQGNQLSGFVSGVDTRNRQIGIQQQNGQVVGISYDQNTQVVYQNQSYPITALENGDQVTLRLQQTQNGGYYTDLVRVDQSVRSSGSTTQSGNVQQIEGSVRNVYRDQGYFTMSTQNGATYTVQLPQQVSRNDVTRFNNLRNGEYVRFYGVVTGNGRIELRQFQ